MPFPLGCCSSRRDSYTTFLLLLHPVHLRGTFMCFSNFMNTSCVEKNTFSSCGFTCIDMCHNPYITCLFQGELSSHVFYSFLSKLKFYITSGNEKKIYLPQPFYAIIRVLDQLHLYFLTRLNIYSLIILSIVFH